MHYKTLKSNINLHKVNKIYKNDKLHSKNCQNLHQFKSANYLIIIVVIAIIKKKIMKGVEEILKI